MPEDIILEMKEIEIAFPSVKALDKVDFTLRKGRFTPSWEKTAPENPH